MSVGASLSEATSDEALELIASGEELRVEFKVGLSSSKAQDICKEIAALATMQGGHLFIGIDDKGGIRGLDDPSGVAQRLEDWISHYIDPVPQVNIRTLNLDNQAIIYVHISKGIQPVYYYDGRPYIRIGTRSSVANSSQLQALLDGGRFAEEMMRVSAEIASMEENLHPSRHVAAAIFGQGELATMNYATLRDRLFADIVERLKLAS